MKRKEEIFRSSATTELTTRTMTMTATAKSTSKIYAMLWCCVRVYVRQKIYSRRSNLLLFDIIFHKSLERLLLLLVVCSVCSRCQSTGIFCVVFSESQTHVTAVSGQWVKFSWEIERYSDVRANSIQNGIVWTAYSSLVDQLINFTNFFGEWTSSSSSQLHISSPFTIYVAL